MKIFFICHRCQWHRWYTLSCEYFREFSKKFNTVLMGYSGAGGKLIHEKIWSRKSRDTVSSRSTWTQNKEKSCYFSSETLTYYKLGSVNFLWAETTSELWDCVRGNVNLRWHADSREYNKLFKEDQRPNYTTAKKASPSIHQSILSGRPFKSVAKFIVRDWGDKVNPMPELTISSGQGLWIWLQESINHIRTETEAG